MYPERVLIIIIDKAVYNKNMKNKNTNLFLTFFIKLISYIKTDIKYFFRLNYFNRNISFLRYNNIQ